MEPAIQGLGWFMRRPPDCLALVPFYRDILGLPLYRGGDTVYMFGAGEHLILEIKNDRWSDDRYPDPDTAPCVPVFRTHDLAAVTRRLGEAGITVQPAETDQWGVRVSFLDPDNHLTAIEARSTESPYAADSEALRRWQAGPQPLPGVGGMPADLHYLARIVCRVENVPAQTAFYRDILGLPLLQATDTLALFDLGETMLLELRPGCPPRPFPEDRGDVPDTFILRVHNLDALAERLAAKGVRQVGDLIRFPSGTRLVYIADPENHITGLEERMTTFGYAEDLEADRRWRAAHPETT